MTHYDLIVIGSGPAGEKGAAQAAYFGKKVALIERASHLGGAGINTGTVPSKTLRETALYFSGLLQRGLYGIDYSLKDGLTIGDLMYRKQIVIESEWGLIQRNLERHHITIVHGAASFKDTHTVSVTGPDGAQDLTGDIILIATGSSPMHPPDVPFDHQLICDSDSILNMNRIPKTMAVVGGGVIGTEYASIFTALGAAVTLIEPRGRVLAFADAEVVKRLMTQLERLGLRFIFNERMTRLEPQGDHVRVSLQSGAVLDFEIVLIAAGRQSNVQGLGLEAIGVELGQRGLIKVNEHYQTSVPHVYAAGDVIGFPALASTSMEQARVAMVHAFDLRYKERVSPIMPTAVYAIPELSSVGLTEEECQAQKIEYLVGRAYFEQNARGLIIGDTSGMVKLIFSPHDKKLLGAHLLGENASELVHIAAHVMMVGGAIDAFIQAVYNYPTLADAYKYAAYDGLQRLEHWRNPNNPEALDVSQPE